MKINTLRALTASLTRAAARLPRCLPFLKRVLRGRIAIRGRVVTKLLAGFALVIFMTAALGWIAIGVASSANDATGNITEQNVNRLGSVVEAVTAIEQERQLTLEYVVESDGRKRIELSEQMRDLDQKMLSLFEVFEDAGTDATTKNVLTALELSIGEYISTREHEVNKAVVEGKVDRARRAAAGVVDEKFDAVEKHLADFRQLEIDNALILRDEAHRSFGAGRAKIVVLMAAAAGLGVLIAFFLSSRIARAMGQVTRAAEELADGDFTKRVEVKTGDEIQTMAEAFNAMASRLQETIESERQIKASLENAVREYSSFAESVAMGNLTARVDANGRSELTSLSGHLNKMVVGLAELSGEVVRGAQDVGTAAHQILESVGEQSTTVTQQTTAISETSVTVQELHHSAKHAAMQGMEVAEQADASVRVGEAGMNAVEMIISDMEEIRTKVERIAEHIESLHQKTQQVGELTAMVEDIAEQSNLLALNAAIEAARAGESGRGFAIVAAEVKKLAHQSKQGTAQVHAILDDITEAGRAAASVTREGVDVAERSRTRAGDAGSAMDQLAQTIRATAQLAKQISTSAQQQSVAIEQVSQSMTEINEAASLFAGGMGDSKLAADGLKTLAEELLQVAGKYKV